MGDDVGVFSVILRLLAGKFLDEGAGFPSLMLADGL